MRLKSVGKVVRGKCAGCGLIRRRVWVYNSKEGEMYFCKKCKNPNEDALNRSISGGAFESNKPKH